MGLLILEIQSHCFIALTIFLELSFLTLIFKSSSYLQSTQNMLGNSWEEK